jgi:hypothetical protein
MTCYLCISFSPSRLGTITTQASTVRPYTARGRRNSLPLLRGNSFPGRCPGLMCYAHDKLLWSRDTIALSTTSDPDFPLLGSNEFFGNTTLRFQVNQMRSLVIAATGDKDAVEFTRPS